MASTQQFRAPTLRPTRPRLGIPPRHGASDNSTNPCLPRSEKKQREKNTQRRENRRKTHRTARRRRRAAAEPRRAERLGRGGADGLECQRREAEVPGLVRRRAGLLADEAQEQVLGADLLRERLCVCEREGGGRRCQRGQGGGWRERNQTSSRRRAGVCLLLSLSRHR